MCCCSLVDDVGCLLLVVCWLLVVVWCVLILGCFRRALIVGRFKVVVLVVVWCVFCG